MARITVEDCLENVENRFELVMVSSKRARQLQTGGKDPLVNEDNDKPTVLALREIAEGFVNASILNEIPQHERSELMEAELKGNDISIEEAMGAVMVAESSLPDETPAAESADSEEGEEQ